jgi:hypothetical protein
MIKYKEIKEKSSMSLSGYLIYLIGIWRLKKNSDNTISISTRFWNPLSWLFYFYIFIYCFVRSFLIEGIPELFRYLHTITIPNFLSDINSAVGKAILKKKIESTGWFTEFNKLSINICDGDTKVKGNLIK